MKERLPLMELVRYVADELRASQVSRDETAEPVMYFSECEVVVSFQVEQDLSGKINLWAVEAGGDVNRSTVHSIKLVYKANEEEIVEEE